MRKIHFLVFSLLISLIQPALAERRETMNKDPKGNVFVFHLDREGGPGAISSLETKLSHQFSMNKEKDGLEMVVPALDERDSNPAILAKKVLELEGNIGAVCHIRFEKTAGPASEKTPSCVIEVYHYPFPPIAKEHIDSPEYTFKFGSDSALMAAALKQHLPDLVRIADIRPMEQANALLPGKILRKSVDVAIQAPSHLSEVQIGELAERLYMCCRSFYEDESYQMMGMVSEKARRHANIEDMEIRVHKFLYPRRDYTDEEQKERDATMAEVVKTLRPYPSGLFIVSDLENISPYSYTIIDSSKQEKDFWFELEEGAFLTSSLKGIVRTVPNRFERYTPLENRYREPRPSLPEVTELDYVIEGATVFEGARKTPGIKTDVGIAGERIAAMGNLKDVPRKETIDGSGLFLTPGFIDIHSHADWNVLDVPYAPSHIRQGITTVLAGNCSFSPLGMGSFYREIEREGSSINIAMLLGNRAVRNKVLGKRVGQPKYAEVYREKELVDLAMEEGAFGMSSGLIYSISEEAYAWELAEMAKQMKPYGGFYASHVRGETDEVIDAIRECIYIGEIAEVPVQISHMKVINKRNWGDMERYLDVMKAARARGLEVTGDQYPWRASGPAAHYRLHKLLVREAIERESPDVVLLKDMPGKYEKYSGKLLTELLEGEGITPLELIRDLQLTEKSDVFATYLCLGEEDVCRPMKEDFVMVCTDASLVSQKSIDQGKVWDEHPRKFRSYPEFFGKYVRERGVCSWELAVYKCTGLPAEKMNLENRGVIRKGAFADLVLFDPETIGPGVDYRDQTPPPVGISYVFINGKPALSAGKMTQTRAGKPIHSGGRIKP